MRSSLFAAAALCAVCSVATAANNMYRWVDARGQVHYSQTPPPSGTFKDVTPRLPPPPAGRAAVSAPKATAAVPTPASVAEMNRKTAEYNETIRAQNCKGSQSRLAAVKAQGSASALRQQADGSVAPYSDIDYQREMAEAQKAVADACAKS